MFVMSKPMRVLGLVLILAACAPIPKYEERRQSAEALAAERGWQGKVIEAGSFALMAYWPEGRAPNEHLSVYIEGDGVAWLTPSQPSNDPTPLDPMGLRLAMAQPDGNVAYLGRPCQYIDAVQTECPQRYWTKARFAEEVVEASNQAIDRLKIRFDATKLTLVGYSGGGAIAALLAGRRNDVVRLVTVAGNLDHVAWTRYHRIQPLDGSLNPVDLVSTLAGIDQWHLVGENDVVTPPFLVEKFARRFPGARRPKVLIKPGFDHRCCWRDHWPQVWATITRP